MSGKKRVRHSPSQIVEKLEDADRLLNSGQSIGQVPQVLGVSEATYHRWRQQYGGMKAQEAKRLKQLERENATSGGGSRSCSPMRTWTTTSSSRRWITWDGFDSSFAAKRVSPMRPRGCREAVAHVRRSLPGVSERRACRALDQPRSTQRYRRRVKAEEGALLRAIEALVCQHPRYGYRMIHALLVADGFAVGRDRVYRLWRDHGYGGKQKPRKKRRLGSSENGIVRRKAESINDVWCWDFIHDRPRKTSEGGFRGGGGW